MANSINKAIIIGRVGKDPEVKNLNGGKTVCTFSLATSEKFKDQADNWKEHTEWHNIVIWGKLAEIAGKYVQKGQPLYVEGKIQYRQYDDKEGQKRYITEINVQNMVLLGGKAEQNKEAAATQQEQPQGSNDGSFDDDLPF